MNFNTATVSRITELTKRQIGYWDTSDLIKPSVQEAEGYGTTRLYSFIDLVQLMVAKRPGSWREHSNVEKGAQHDQGCNSGMFRRSG